MTRKQRANNTASYLLDKRVKHSLGLHYSQPPWSHNMPKRPQYPSVDSDESEEASAVETSEAESEPIAKKSSKKTKAPVKVCPWERWVTVHSLILGLVEDKGSLKIQVKEACWVWGRRWWLRGRWGWACAEKAKDRERESCMTMLLCFTTHY